MLPFELILLSFATNSGALAVSNKHRPNQDLLSNGNRVHQQYHPIEDPNYQCFGGDIDNYPAESSWLSWKDLWNVNSEQILYSNSGNTYVQHYIQEAILKVSVESSIDARLILALIMQESHGRADAKCTGPIPRCGILHAHKGHSFDARRPEASILEMTLEGIHGDLKRGMGYADFLYGKPSVADADSGRAFAAARAYNSGSVSSDLDVARSQGEAGYVNDVANRLLGWDGRGKPFKKCH